MLHPMTTSAPAQPWASATPESLALGPLLARALDEVDFGIVLLAESGSVLHLNHRARRAMTESPVLEIRGNRLHTAEPRSMARLQQALQDATQRELRRLLALGSGDNQQLAALVPVQPGVAALLLGRSSVCEVLSLHCFARDHQLTAAETRVLMALGRGDAPSEIAREQGVKLSTVRTQISAIRHKTGTSTITALVRLVAGLPPMVGALRN